MDKLCVVVPIYNVANYLPNSIRSLKEQTLKDFKVILVNDGSTDNSKEVAMELIGDDARFELVNKPNGGLSDARNYGMRFANSEYIYFFDSDDTLQTDCLKRCVEAMDKNNSDMVIFDYYQYWQSKDYKEVIENKYSEGIVTSLNQDPTLMVNIANAAWNKMYRLSLFKDNHIEYPKGHIYEDLGTTYRLLLHANNVCFVRKPLYNYIVDRVGNITSTINLTKCRDVLIMCALNSDYYKKQGAFEQYYEQLKYLSGINIIETLRKLIDVPYCDHVLAFIDDCFDYLQDNYLEYPRCIYNVKQRKNDWIYTNRYVLKVYLMIRSKLRRSE